jgi:ergothioneine biosynthesis protein EgtB
LLDQLWDRYRAVRETTERLCAPLAVEDYVVQAMPEVSPAKWHLAHSAWFFETFVLAVYLPGYRPAPSAYRRLFNSYCNGVGPQASRPQRGHLSRPTVAEVYDYRHGVDRAMADLLAEGIPEREPKAAGVIDLGLNHEQQHQELLLTDVKYNLAANLARPAYHDRPIPRGRATAPLHWIDFEGGLTEVGHPGGEFAFDNEGPRHRVYLRPFRLGSRPVTNGEYLEFIHAGGYRQWQWWLGDGWKTVCERGWEAPLYWELVDATWWTHTLSGPTRLDEHAPVCHASYYEADAYARWRGCRLPTEHEWEYAVEREALRGNFLEAGLYHAVPAEAGHPGLQQAFGDVWEWTMSPYVPYPGFQPLEGALGEYDGKFMSGQIVLRGGSCATPASHIRRTYRNYFPPDARWQFSGIRLVEGA